VGFVNFWADPIDGKVRTVLYHVTNRQLAGIAAACEPGGLRISFRTGPNENRPCERRPQDSDGHMIRFSGPDAYEPTSTLRSVRSKIMACELR
jgi:hypothetical protein